MANVIYRLTDCELADPRYLRNALRLCSFAAADVAVKSAVGLPPEAAICMMIAGSATTLSMLLGAAAAVRGALLGVTPNLLGSKPWPLGGFGTDSMLLDKLLWAFFFQFELLDGFNVRFAFGLLAGKPLNPSLF